MTRMNNPGANSSGGATLVATPHESRASTLPQNSTRSLWLWVGGAFAVLILVWAVLFTVARSAKVETVPLATKGARP